MGDSTPRDKRGACVRANLPCVRRALALLFLFAPTIALAHRFEHPKVIRVGVQRDEIVVAYSYDVNPGTEALRTRALFDRDADGRLDAEEQARLQKYLVDTALLWMRVRVQDRPIDLRTSTVTANRLDRPADDTTTLGISALVRVPRPPGALVIELEDRDKDARKHVPVVVDFAGEESVALASQGEFDPEARQLRGVRLEPERALVLRLSAQP